MKNLLKKSLLFTLISLFSCSDIYDENFTIDNNLYDKTQVTSVTNKLSNDFVKKLASVNIYLTPEEQEKVINLLNVKAKAEWTPGSENNSKLNLEKHFLKHGGDFNPPFKNSQEYLKSALNAANSNDPNSNYYFDIKYYKDDKIVSFIKWNSKTYELTVTRENSQIATYFLDNKINNQRFILYSKN